MLLRVLLLAIPLLLAGCASAPEDLSGVAATHTTSVKMGPPGREYAFEPARLVVPAGSVVELQISNVGELPHSFVVDKLQVNSGSIPPGANATLKFRAAKAATLEVYCDVPSHREAGMVGTLVIAR